MIIRFKKLSESAITPTIGSAGSAGYDLYSIDTISIAPGETIKIHTGIAMEIPAGYFGGEYARSGLATKEGLRPANCVGIIDSDYRGEIIVPLHNDSKEKKLISYGERVAQLIVQPYLISSLEETNDISDTVRGNGGFGSTGSF